MHRSHYILAFMALATAFVPVLVNFGLIVFIVPTACALSFAAAEIFSADLLPGMGFLVYSALYLALFYGCARLTFWLFSLVRSRSVSTALQITVLLGLFTFSFLSKITYVSI